MKKLIAEGVDGKGRPILRELDSENLYEYYSMSGFLFSGETISRYFLSLKTKPFTILTGISGTGKTNISLAIEVIVLVIYLLYAYTLVYKYNIQITEVWTAEIIYGSLLAVLSYFYLKSGKWKDSKI